MGEFKPAAPPAWLMRLELSSGLWRCLVGLWAFAPYHGGSERPPVVWPSRATLAESTGQKEETVKKQLRKLAALGWIRRLDGTRVALAEGVAFDAGEHSPPHPGNTAPPGDSSTRGPQSPPPGNPVPLPGTTVPAPRGTQSPQTLQGTLQGTLQEHSKERAERETASARHQRISRKSAEQRRASKPETPSAPGLSAEIIRAVEAADNGAWYPQLNTPSWAQALAEAVDEMALKPGQITRVLEAWTRESEHGLAEGQPDKRGLWWSRGRPWVRSQIRQRGASRAPAHREYVPRTAEDVARG